MKITEIIPGICVKMKMMRMRTMSIQILGLKKYNQPLFLIKQRYLFHFSYKHAINFCAFDKIKIILRISNLRIKFDCQINLIFSVLLKPCQPKNPMLGFAIEMN